MKSLRNYILEKLRSFNVWIMVGLPGSGKSTWIKKNLPKDIKIVNQDQIRVDLGIMDDIDVKRVGNKDQEAEVSKINQDLINKYMNDRIDFAIDNTNIKSGRVLNYYQMLKRKGANVKVIIIDTPVHTCIDRRKNDIPEETIKKMHEGVKKTIQTFKNNEDTTIIK